MISVWQAGGFLLYSIVYFTIFNVYDVWPEATWSAACFKILPILHLAFSILSIDEDVVKTSSKTQTDARKWTTVGLIFSALGDSLLVWKETLFLPGTLAFGTAHICYIRAFGLKPFGGKPTATSFAVFAVSMYFFVVKDIPGNVPSAMQYALVLYIALISTMMWRATASMQYDTSINNISRFLGAIVFSISDVMVVRDKFYAPFQHGPFYIMVTYYLAQFFIASSAI